ncbi:MAG: hypothetical protein IKJ59_16390 [Clostridia bacterium]|nr:hypothetical protein [Clostridia bacterium]MBR3920280.1 hypothetical protein [Clostridia bacterium]
MYAAAELIVLGVCREYGMEPGILIKMFNEPKKSFSSAEHVIVRNWLRLDSIAPLIYEQRLFMYLLEDEARKIKAKKNEVLLTDNSIQFNGIEPGDILLFDPRDTVLDGYMALEIDGFRFAAVVEDFKHEPDKYYIVPDLHYNRDFIIFKHKVKVLGKIIGWRKSGEKTYKDFVQKKG